MLKSALGFFLLAVVLGIYLLSLILRSRQVPKTVAMTHGLFATIGLILLVIYPFYFAPAPMLSMILLIFAALGGFTMAYMSMSGKTVPAWMAIGHGMLAIIAVVTLIVFLIL